MKALGYEFERRTYRWLVLENKTFRHECFERGFWVLADIPPTPAAAEALAALIEDTLIEDMQGQVIAEWTNGWTQLRARDAEDGIIIEWYSNHRGEWLTFDSNLTKESFRAGYEAGKAAR